MQETQAERPFARAFVAIEIPADVRAKLAAVQDELKKTRAHVSWVPAANIHLSLAFLGDVSRDSLPLIGAALDEAAALTEAFSLFAADIGVFGSPRSPRVIWAGIGASPSLQSLQKTVADHIRALRIELEDRPFKAHLTLGRVRSSRGRADLAAALERLGPREFGAFQVRRVLLMESRLQPGGAEYTPRHAAPLAEADGADRGPES